LWSTFTNGRSRKFQDEGEPGCAFLTKLIDTFFWLSGSFTVNSNDFQPIVGNLFPIVIRWRVDLTYFACVINLQL